MRFGIGLIVIGVLAIGTVRHLPHFRTDADLWGRAVTVHPHLPRPALNLATVYRKAGRNFEATLWLLRAADDADRGIRPDEVRAMVKAQLLFLSAFGDDVCSQPDVQPYCS